MQRHKDFLHFCRIKKLMALLPYVHKSKYHVVHIGVCRSFYIPGVKTSSWNVVAPAFRILERVDPPIPGHLQFLRPQPANMARFAPPLQPNIEGYDGSVSSMAPSQPQPGGPPADYIRKMTSVDVAGPLTNPSTTEKQMVGVDAPIQDNHGMFDGTAMAIPTDGQLSMGVHQGVDNERFGGELPMASSARGAFQDGSRLYKDGMPPMTRHFHNENPSHVFNSHWSNKSTGAWSVDGGIEHMHFGRDVIADLGDEAAGRFHTVADSFPHQVNGLRRPLEGQSIYSLTEEQALEQGADLIDQEGKPQVGSDMDRAPDEKRKDRIIRMFDKPDELQGVISTENQEDKSTSCRSDGDFLMSRNAEIEGSGDDVFVGPVTVRGTDRWQQRDLRGRGHKLRGKARGGQGRRGSGRWPLQFGWQNLGPDRHQQRWRRKHH